MIAGLLILMALAGVPPLTADQQARLAVDGPGDQLEGPALGPLLENILTWEPLAPDATGAAEPDYDALLADPAIGRGELFLVEGIYAGRARRVGLNRSGPWGDALTEWVLIVRDEPQQVAVIYFVDPDQTLEAPRTGSRVRVPTRFYKVWTDTDQAGQPTDYLTFIARSPLASVPTGGAARLGSALPLILGVLVLVVIYVFVLRLSRAARRRRQSGLLTAKSGGDVMLSDLPATSLPDDPAEALERLADRPHDS